MKRNPASRLAVDLAKKVKLRFGLTKLSEKVRKAELSQSPPVQSRTEVVAAPKTTVKMNIRGDLRGIHNRNNPPSSEQMKKVRAMRRLYNKQMPVMRCDGCALSNVCPSFQAGYECAFLPFFNAHGVKSEQDVTYYMQELLAANMRRVHVGTMVETLSGGKPTPELTEAMNMVFFQAAKLQELTNKAEATVSVETDDASVIGRLFGDMQSLLGATIESSKEEVEALPIPSSEDDKQADIEGFNEKDVDTLLLKEHASEELSHDTGTITDSDKGASPLIAITKLKKSS